MQETIVPEDLNAPIVQAFIRDYVHAVSRKESYKFLKFIGNEILNNREHSYETTTLAILRNSESRPGTIVIDKVNISEQSKKVTAISHRINGQLDKISLEKFYKHGDKLFHAKEFEIAIFIQNRVLENLHHIEFKTNKHNYKTKSLPYSISHFNSEVVDKVDSFYTFDIYDGKKFENILYRALEPYLVKGMNICCNGVAGFRYAAQEEEGDLVLQAVGQIQNQETALPIHKVDEKYCVYNFRGNDLWADNLRELFKIIKKFAGNTTFGFSTLLQARSNTLNPCAIFQDRQAAETALIDTKNKLAIFNDGFAGSLVSMESDSEVDENTFISCKISPITEPGEHSKINMLPINIHQRYSKIPTTSSLVLPDDYNSLVTLMLIHKDSSTILSALPIELMPIITKDVVESRSKEIEATALPNCDKWHNGC